MKPTRTSHESRHTSGVDWCAQRHALAIAESIMAYWAKRGVKVTAWIEPVYGLTKRNREGTSVYAVRSDLKLGGGR